MRIKYLENSRPTRPWVKRWMLWAFGFVVVFLPRFIGAILVAPIIIARDEWEELRDEVSSFKCN